jgi:hypothetical protein
MKMGENFQVFLSTFQHLACEANVLPTMFKDKLHHRLTWKLQEATYKGMDGQEICLRRVRGDMYKICEPLIIIIISI